MSRLHDSASSDGGSESSEDCNGSHGAAVAAPTQCGGNITPENFEQLYNSQGSGGKTRGSAKVATPRQSGTPPRDTRLYFEP